MERKELENVSDFILGEENVAFAADLRTVNLYEIPQDTIVGINLCIL
ncbi:hypothetical protein [Clostridium sp.]